MDDDIFQKLKAEFIDDARDRVGDMMERLELVEKGRLAPGAALLALRREAHSLKGMGASFGYLLISMIGHRLEDYLATADLGQEQVRQDLRRHLDTVEMELSRPNQCSHEQMQAILRDLPMPRGQLPANVPQTKVEVMLVTASRTVAKMAADELRACGYRVIHAHSPLEALTLCVRARPDLVLTSAVLEDMSGVDLLRALAVMGPTRDLPAAIVTSYGPGHAELRGVPEGATILRLGPQFRDQLGEYLATLDLG